MTQTRSVVLVLLALTPATAWAQKQTWITSSGLPPVAFVRSAAQTAELATAVAGIVPRDLSGVQDDVAGRICGMGLGMSNARDYHTRASSLLNNVEPYKSGKGPRFKFSRAAQSGQTARDWENPLDPAWAYADERAVRDCGSVQQVQWVHIYLTNSHPATYGVMTAAQVLNVVDAALVHFPHVRLLTTSTIQWTGQSVDGRAPVEAVHGDDALLASLVGTYHGVFVDYLAGYADGDQPHPVTGLRWFTADSVDDGVHPTYEGAHKMATTMWGRMWADPLYGFLRAGWNPTPPPPPPPPLTVPWSAMLTKDGASCSVSGVLPNGATAAPYLVPVEWCDGIE